jgi:hypothetical protein
MVNDIESDMLAGKAAPPSDIDTYLGRRVAEFNFVIHDYIPGTIMSVRSHGADPSTVKYRIRYDEWKEQDVLKQDLPLLIDNFRARFGQDATKLTTEDEPTRRSHRKRKLTTVKIGNYTVLAQDMNDSDESKSFEGGLKPSSKKSAPKSSTASKKTDKPPQKKMKKDNISSSKVRDERCVSKIVPPEILERFFHESGNSSKTKEVTLKKQVLHGSTFENTDNFCGKIVTPIVQSHKYGKFKLYFVLHFDGEEEMMYLTPLFRNGIVKTTGMNKYCVNVIPSTGPVTADSCWKAMNVIHVPCSEWRVVESRAISKTPDVRCEKWEIFEPEFDRIDIPVYRKSKVSTAPRTKNPSSSVKRSSASVYPTSEDEDENSEKESDATSDTGDENSVAILYHDEGRNESIIKSHLSNENGSEDTGSLMEEGNTVNSVSKPSKDYREVFVGDTFDKQSNEKEVTDISGDTVTSLPMNKTDFKLSDTIQFKSPFKRVDWDRIDGIIQGGKVKDDMKSPDGVAMPQGQSRKFSEDSRGCESPMAHERLGIVKTEANEDRQDEEDIILKGITFDQGFEALVAFKKKYNHVSVPWNYVDTPWLSAWCNQKRVHYNDYQNMNSQDENWITENQVRELKNIGFDFHDRTNQTFDEKLNELKEFKRIYGHDWFEHWRDKMRTDAKKRGLSDNALAFRRKTHSNPNKERNLLMVSVIKVYSMPVESQCLIFVHKNLETIDIRCSHSCISYSEIYWRSAVTLGTFNSRW